MAKYRVGAMIEVEVQDIIVEIDMDDVDRAGMTHEDVLKDAINGAIDDKIVLLDIKGGRSGEGGSLTIHGAVDVNFWDRID